MGGRWKGFPPAPRFPSVGVRGGGERAALLRRAFLPWPGTLLLREEEAVWYAGPTALFLRPEAFSEEGLSLARAVAPLAAPPWDLLEEHIAFQLEMLAESSPHEELLLDFVGDPEEEKAGRVREVLEGEGVMPEVVDLYLLAARGFRAPAPPPLSPKGRRLLEKAGEAVRELRELGAEWGLPLFVLVPEGWPLWDQAAELVEDLLLTPAYEAGEEHILRVRLASREEAEVLARALRGLLGGLAALVREWGGEAGLRALKEALEPPPPPEETKAEVLLPEEVVRKGLDFAGWRWKREGLRWGVVPLEALLD